MTIGKEIEKLRIEHNITILDVCNALLLSSEPEYWEFVVSHRKLSIIQISGFTAVFHIPLKSKNR